MLDESDPAIERELARRKEGSLKEKEDKTASQKWPSQHMRECEKRGIPWPVPVDDALAASEWYQTSPKREKEVLALGFLDHIAKNIDYIDSYHSANRIPSSARVLPIVLPNSTFFDYNNMRFLLGRENLRFQGLNFKDDVLDRFTEQDLGNLAGNAFAGTVMLAVLIAVFSSLEFRAESDAERDGKTDNILK
ncbi:unnamed protein product, partial [Polarella glacialis]